ncbi:MAG: hypothetical protein N5P05_004068 (plasmid) [Chroococcopsis gigantea SAG 12.99]|jgi:hypothetical protein|nr:hypothetical protein [Chroococcopsis gigantea SAG 12.99]
MINRSFLSIVVFSIAGWLAVNEIVNAQIIDARLYNEVEKADCQRTVELMYRSNQLQSPSDSEVYYFEGVLRRLGKRGDHHEYGDSKHNCWPVKNRQTVYTNLVVFDPDTQRVIKVKKISGIYKEGYSVLKPVSFSGDGRYLFLHNELGFNGGHGDFYYYLFDVDKQAIVDIPSCETDEYDNYKFDGFISDSEILFRCQSPAMPPTYHVFNLNTKKLTVYKGNVAKLPEYYYGNNIKPLKVLKRQVFTR